MATEKLTETVVEKLKAPTESGKQELTWDTELKGFGVLCSGVSNRKTYVAQAAVKGLTRRVTVGRCELIKVKDARKKAAKELANMTLDRDPKAGGRGVPTLATVLEEYLKARKGNPGKNVKGLSVNAEVSYSNLVNKHLSDWLKKPLSAITVDMVNQRHSELGESVGPATANGAMRVLRLLWNFELESRPLLGPAPVKLRSRWFEVKPRKRHVKTDELPAFYKAVCKLPNPVHRDYILTLLFTGMRRRECAALKWDYIDLKAKTLTLPEEITKTNEELVLPLSDFLHGLLVARRALGNAGGWVFPSNSKSGHIEEPKFALDLVEKATGINVSPHDLRRTFVTTADKCPMSETARKLLVNHSIGKSVHSGYVQRETEDLREPVQEVANKLKELCGITEPVGDNVKRLR